MDPISLAVLAALAGGAGGEIGRLTWTGLTGLIRRRRADTSSTGTATGQALELDRAEAALATLEREPEDLECARELEHLLRAQVEADGDFAHALQVWESMFRASLAADPQAAAELQAAAQAIAPGSDTAVKNRVIHNDFRDGNFQGPVQGSGTMNNHFE
ncbi:hypothetical protein ACFWFI_06385 [Streptomyces sp. NPDC060209]|uniref:hypothetical protein n=1 Tax=Streptomyces sp. NPDC060209 TaxID=3347073 RepID=UPI00365999FB